ncbi:MAG TPA: hypothetical protein PKO06_19940 [Candidatus Ozemobacteraceae bacterium]|nr:hypothetical protein [Candidatus Ozemobacteraceae bacterium]
MLQRFIFSWLIMCGLLSAPILEAAPIIIQQGTLIRIKLEQTISTKTNRTGDMISFATSENLAIGKKVVVKKGAFVQAQLEKVRGPGRFGKNGSLKIRYLFVKAANGRQVPITLGERSAKTNESMGFAAGASAAGYMILGPVGLLGGAFVRGQHITIPAGTELMVEVARDTVY